MQNKDPKQPPPLPGEKKEEPRVTPAWGVQPTPYPAYPKPASPVMPGMPAPQRPVRTSTMQYGLEEPAAQPPKDTTSKMLAVQGMKTAVQTNLKGSVLGMAGQGDAESLCAVAALAHAALAASEDSFGLGELQAWSMTTSDVSVFVTRNNEQIFAVSGEPTKNPESVLRRILATQTEGR